MNGLKRYGTIDQGYFLSPTRTGKDGVLETKDLEEKFLNSMGASDVRITDDTSTKTLADTLSGMIKGDNQTTLHYNDPRDVKLAREIRRRYGPSVKQFLTWHCTPDPEFTDAAYYEKKSAKEHGPAFDGHIGVSNHVRNQLVLSGFPKNKVHVIYNGVDTEIYRSISNEEKKRLREELGLDGYKVVTYMGRIEHNKGMEILYGLINSQEMLMDKNLALLIASPSHNEVIKTMNHIKKNRPDIAKEGRIKFVVDISKYTKPLELELPTSAIDRTDMLDIKENIRNHYESYFEKSGFYNVGKFGESQMFSGTTTFPVTWITDIGLFPTYWEALGLVALEYIASGVPVIGSGVGGAKEVIGKHSTSKIIPLSELVTSPTPAALSNEHQRIQREREIERVTQTYAKEIGDTLRDKQNHPLDALEGRRLIMEQGWSLDRMTSKYLDLYLR